MATVETKIEFVLISKDDLRKMIAEEIRKAVEPGAIRPPYLPPVPQRQDWWQAPVITCGTAVAVADPNQIVINADQ